MILDWLSDLWPAIDREIDGMAEHHGTLSEALSRLFRTETMPGKMAFAFTAFAGCTWLVVHIVTFQYSTKGQAKAHV